MKKLSLVIMILVVALTSCKKTPEVNLKYVDVERDLITVGMTTATVQCDYQYMATLKNAYFHYGEGKNEADMNTAEMRVVQNTLYVDLVGLKENTTYSYYYEFYNGFNSMRTEVRTFKTEASPIVVTLPTVITAEVTEISENSAQCGGEVTNDGGAEVTERGICWGVNANPTLSDNHIAAGSGLGEFTALIDNLQDNTIYYVRAYATNEAGTAYGLDKEFTTHSGGGGSEDHDYVDLGLPSGLLWATCNVGANAPEECGDYFAWGETQPKTTYNWSTYQYANGTSWDDPQLTKYCNKSSYGYNGFIDNLITLLPEDDAAAAGVCPPKKNGRNYSATRPSHGRPRMVRTADASLPLTAIVFSCLPRVFAMRTVSLAQAATATIFRVRSTRASRAACGSSGSLLTITTRGAMVTVSTGSLYGLLGIHVRTNPCSVICRRGWLMMEINNNN